jgi:hypothetical protein
VHCHALASCNLQDDASLRSRSFLSSVIDSSYIYLEPLCLRLCQHGVAKVIKILYQLSIGSFSKSQYSR